MASSTIIQCTSSSSSHAIKTYEYDVFVSFRGEDTRNNFTGFLFEALSKNGIEAFKDNEDLKKGESIAPELLQAIQGSRIFVVVFSKNYASSTWCLRELVEICNCIETSPRQLLPIFYDVDPSEVRKQSGYYDLAFTKHEETFKEDKEKTEEVLRWRKTLSKVADFCGWHIGNKPQHEEIKEIAQNIKEKLGSKFSSLPKDNLVGMESHVEELARLLNLKSVNDVRVVGISGMGGIGKTTLARALYEQISHQYNSHCFIDDVSQTYRKFSGALGVQKQLLSQCIKERNIEICNVSEGTQLVCTRLHKAKGLVVFDNVDQVEQLNIFSGSREFTMLRECLGGGSRVIIISRDEHILKTHGVDDVYKVEPLNPEDAIQLFCRKAFKGDYISSGYEGLTHDILWHVQGHPLTIEVIGSSLFGKSISQWRSTLAKLRNNRSENIMDKLRIGFDELDSTNKEIFLDIACLFEPYIKEEGAREILDFRGFYPDMGLQVLIDKSLIIISEGYIHMHNMLRDLGKYIVREKSPNQPTKWSRLWDFQDLYKVMSDNMEETNIEAIVIDSCRMEFHGTTMTVNALSKMRNLKLLILPDMINYSGSLNDLSNELGYIAWPEFPFECLPLCFQPHKLVELYLHESNIKQLWDGTKALPKLRRLDLSNSKNLVKMQNLGDAINLESLNLEGCIRLNHIDESFGFPKNLTSLDLRDCRNLINLPHFREALTLELIDLGGCIQLKQIDSSIGFLKNLTSLNLKDCRSLINLPHFRGAVNLELIDLGGCIQLKQIDSSIGFLKNLTSLDLNDCRSLINLPHFRQALNLKSLNLEGCIQLKQIDSSFGFPKNLSRLNLKDCKSLVNLPHFREAVNLISINLEGCSKLRQIDSSIGLLRKLDYLNLKDCKNLVSLPSSILELNSLEYLSLFGCSKLYSNQLLEEPRDAQHSKKLCTGKAPNHSQSTSTIVKRWFTWLSSLYSREQNESVNWLLPSLSIFSHMRELDLSFCNLVQVPNAIGKLHSLERLSLRGNNFGVMPSLKELSKLVHLNLQHCKRLEYLPELPSRTYKVSAYFKFTLSIDEDALGVNTFNCPELARREGCSNMCFPWIMQLVKAYHDFELFNPRISSIIPGCEIPRWFKSEHVCTDNLMRIEHVMHSNDWIGVACCAIFVARPCNQRAMAPPKKEPHFTTCIPLFFREGLVTVESDHLCLICVTRNTSSYYLLNSSVVKIVGSKGYDVEVKKYGYRFLYEKDLVPSNFTMVRSETSFPGKRKFSAIQEI